MVDRDGPGTALKAGEPELEDRIDVLLPPGTRVRRLAEWGVVFWATIGVALVLWLLSKVFSELAPVFPVVVTAALVVLILNPIVKLLMRVGLPRRVAATMVLLGAVVALPIAVDLITRTLIDQGNSLLHSPLVHRHGGMFNRLEASSNTLLQSVGHGVKHWVATHQHSAGKALASLGPALTRLGIVLALGGLLGYLLLMSGPELFSSVLVLVPQARRGTMEELGAEMGRIVGGYVRARLIVSAVVGAISTLGMWAVGMRFWLVLGLLVGVANLIPTLGSWIGGIPVALVALLTEPPGFLFVVLGVIVFAHLVDGFILSPLILKETTNLHPVVVLLSVIAGAEVFGIWGILAAIPVAGIAQFLLARYVAPRLPGRVTPELQGAVGPGTS